MSFTSLNVGKLKEDRILYVIVLNLLHSMIHDIAQGISKINADMRVTARSFAEIFNYANQWRETLKKIHHSAS